MKKTIILTAAVLLLWQTASAEGPFFNNPVWPKNWPDPTVFYDAGAGQWVSFSTEGSGRRNYLVSTDLVHWRDSGKRLIAPSAYTIMSNYANHRWAPGNELVFGPGYNGAATKLDEILVALGWSDIITFHCYYGPEELETFIKMLSRFRRPMVCQEYMGRTLGSTFEFCMPVLKREKVGALNWGLVEGKCKYRYPWGHKPEQGEPDIWFHSIFWEDYTPWRESEVLFIKQETADKSVAGKKAKYPIE